MGQVIIRIRFIISWIVLLRKGVKQSWQYIRFDLLFPFFKFVIIKQSCILDMNTRIYIIFMKRLILVMIYLPNKTKKFLGKRLQIANDEM